VVVLGADKDGLSRVCSIVADPN